MKQVVIIPADVGALCRKSADCLDGVRVGLDSALALWADADDPDWYVQLPHLKIERMRESLSKVAELFDFLARHGDA